MNHDGMSDTKTNQASSINWLSLFLIVAAAVVWFAAPFVAINYLGWGDQPTALQLVTGDFSYLGDLEESPAFWAGITTIIGIGVCFLATLAKVNILTRIVAILTEIPLGYVLYQMTKWADDGEELMEILGLGFWGLMALLFLIFCVSGKISQTGRIAE